MSHVRVMPFAPSGTARVYDSATHNCLANMSGHKGEISKVIFSPQGNRLLTVSSDKTARLWDAVTGDCVQVRQAHTPACDGHVTWLQVLEGHGDEVFSSAFNYEGDIILTGSKDNTCRLWR